MGNGCNGTTLLDPSTVFRMTKTDLVNQAKLSPTRFIFGSEISRQARDDKNNGFQLRSNNQAQDDGVLGFKFVRF